MSFDACRSRLAVLVAARIRNDAGLLRSCLESLIRTRSCAAGVWGHVDIVVLDDSSNPPLRRVLPKSVLSEIQLLQNGGTPGQAGALNYGLRAQRADIYAFTDADCVADRDWISSLAHAYSRHPDASGIVGPNWLHARGAKGWSSWLTEQESKLVEAVSRRYINDSLNAFRIDCRNLSLKRRFVRELAPDGTFFVEAQGPSVSGLTSARLRRLDDESFNLKIYFAPDLLVRHEPVDNLRQQLRRYFRWGREGAYSKVYRKEGYGLLISFFRFHFHRHFIHPCFSTGVSVAYLWLVHSAYWAGIMVDHLSNSAIPKLREASRSA